MPQRQFPLTHGLSGIQQRLMNILPGQVRMLGEDLRLTCIGWWLLGDHLERADRVALRADSTGSDVSVLRADILATLAVVLRRHRRLQARYGQPFGHGRLFTA